MRTIKIRAWDKTGPCMIGPHDITDTIWNHKEIRQLPIMLFTGLSDKNGTEIYEGDIVQYKSYHINKRWWSSLSDIEVIKKECEEHRKEIYINRCTVNFQDGSFFFDHAISSKDVARGKMYETGQTHWCDTESKAWDFEVIGNIHKIELLES